MEFDDDAMSTDPVSFGGDLCVEADRIDGLVESVAGLADVVATVSLLTPVVTAVSSGVEDKATADPANAPVIRTRIQRAVMTR
jgi:hypothetical protein